MSVPMPGPEEALAAVARAAEQGSPDRLFPPPSTPDGSSAPPHGRTPAQRHGPRPRQRHSRGTWRERPLSTALGRPSSPAPAPRSEKDDHHGRPRGRDPRPRDRAVRRQGRADRRRRRRGRRPAVTVCRFGREVPTAEFVRLPDPLAPGHRSPSCRVSIPPIALHARRIGSWRRPTRSSSSKDPAGCSCGSTSAADAGRPRHPPCAVKV